MNFLEKNTSQRLYTSFGEGRDAGQLGHRSPKNSPSSSVLLLFSGSLPPSTRLCADMAAIGSERLKTGET